MHETKDADFKAYFINWARIWCQKAKKEYGLFLFFSHAEFTSTILLVVKLVLL